MDEEATPDRIVKRRPWLVCPVRSKYAKQFPFPDISYSEDSIWMNQVLTFVKVKFIQIRFFTATGIQRRQVKPIKY